MTNEALTESIAKVAKDNPDVAQWLSAIVGTTVNKAAGKDVSVGATTAQYGMKWNDMLANNPGKYAFYDNYEQAKNDQEVYVSSESIEITEYDTTYLKELAAFKNNELISEYKDTIPFAASVTYAATHGLPSKTFSLGSQEAEAMSNSRALRDEIYAMLAFNGTGNKDEVNIFSKNLVFNMDSACRALNEDGISAAWSEFGAALAFHRATYSVHAKMIGSDGDYLTYYVYGFVGDKYKFRESDTGYQSTASILNFIGVYWQQIGAIRPIDIYVEFQMTMTVPR